MVEEFGKYKCDFDIVGIKEKPFDIRVNILINIIDHIQNKAFICCTGNYYNKLHDLIGDWDSAKKEEFIEEE